MAESFVIMRVGVRVGGAWHHAAGAWHLPSYWTAADGEYLAEVVNSVVMDWLDARTKGTKGMHRMYHSAVEVSLCPPQSDALLAETLLYPVHDLRRFKVCPPPAELSSEPAYD